MTASDHLKQRTGSLGGDQDDSIQIRNVSDEALGHEWAVLRSGEIKKTFAALEDAQTYANELLERIEEMQAIRHQIEMASNWIASCQEDNPEGRKCAVAHADLWERILARYDSYDRAKRTEAALAQKTRECEEWRAEHNEQFKAAAQLADGVVRLTSDRDYFKREAHENAERLTELRAQVEQLGRQVAEMEKLCGQAREDFAEVVCSIGEEPPCWKALLDAAKCSHLAHAPSEERTCLKQAIYAKHHNGN